MSEAPHNIRIIIVHNDKRLLFLLNRALDFDKFIEQICTKLGITKTNDLILLNQKLNAEITDPSVILENDEIEIIERRLMITSTIASRVFTESLSDNLTISDTHQHHQSQYYHQHQYHHQRPHHHPFALHTQSSNNNNDDDNEDNENDDEDDENEEGNGEEDEEQEAEIDIRDIEDIVFTGSRDDLRNKLNEWANELKFEMIYTHSKKWSSKYNAYVHTLYCNRHIDFACPFKLVYHEDEEGMLSLFSYNRFHENHKLDLKSRLKMDNKVRADIKLMHGKCEVSQLTEILNEKYKKNLTYGQVIREVIKLKEKTTGKASDDAKHLIRFSEEEKNLGLCYYESSFTEENELKQYCYFPAKSKIKYKLYDDVMVIDSTFKTNRFNMPLVNFIGIDNEGKNVVFGFGLLSDESEDSYAWLLSKFLEYFGKSPIVIFSDECPSIGAGIAKVFPNSVHLLCAWHMFRNLSRRFRFLMRKKTKYKKTVVTNDNNKEKVPFSSSLSGNNIGDAKMQQKEDYNERSKLYKKIKSLPFCEDMKEFYKIVFEVEESIYIDDNEKKYFKDKIEKCMKWAKCYIQKHFTCGIVSTSRVESFNSFVKSKVQSNSSLNEIIEFYKKCVYCAPKEDECEIYERTNDPKQNINSLSELQKLDGIHLVKQAAKVITQYAKSKLMKELFYSLNFNIIKESENEWLAFLFYFFPSKKESPLIESLNSTRMLNLIDLMI